LRKRTAKIGFIIDGQLPTLRKVAKGRCHPGSWLCGWDSCSSIGMMRFEWIAEAVNADSTAGMRYELYRPWKRYDAVIFQKSMDDDCIALAEELRGKATTLFDANVDYFTPADGPSYFAGMAPTTDQRRQAIRMAETCHGVIGDSLHIAEVASAYCPKTCYIPDNVPERLLAKHATTQWVGARKIPLLWSGQAHKMFELLAIRDVLEQYSGHIRLRLVANSLEALDRIAEPYRSELKELLAALDVEHIPFTTLEDLMQLYDQGGIAVSPRFLDNTYNQGHTEWKIALPMARGRVTICSPQRSYSEVARLSENRGIRICEGIQEWANAFQEVLDGDIDWQGEQAAAINVVREHYTTRVIAEQHRQFVAEVIAA